MQSKAKTVAAYLKELPADRRAAIETLRQVFLDNIDDDIVEIMSYGMIGYHVSFDAYPAGYHCDPKVPLPYAGLASQKNHMSLYMMGLYIDPDDVRWFENAWKAAGKKLDMGKSCVRFKKIEDVPLEVVAEAIQRMPSPRYIHMYESYQLNSGSGSKATSKAAAKKTAKKPAQKAAAKKAAKK
ncbi:MAG: DUF1801 domain-containing protein [Planctomycetes bacterium]|nr:DUF1801 domain-containing protein [Planctomycetota bacterium]